MSAPTTKRRWFRFGVGAMIVAALISLVSVREQPKQVLHPETGFKFPQLEEVSSISFDALDREGTDQDVAGEVARQYWADLLAGLQPSEHDPNPVTWSVIGHMRIETKSRQTIYVMLSYPSTVGLAFRAGDKEWSSRRYFFGGNGPQLKAVLSEIAASLPLLQKKSSQETPAAAR